MKKIEKVGLGLVQNNNVWDVAQILVACPVAAGVLIIINIKITNFFDKCDIWIFTTATLKSKDLFVV